MDADAELKQARIAVQGLGVFFVADRSSRTERRIPTQARHHSESGIPFVIASGKLDLTTGTIVAGVAGRCLGCLPKTGPPVIIQKKDELYLQV
jgi:hypothetical protein